MRLLVAMPVYNESRHVQHVLQRVWRYHTDILIVDDGSTDHTSKLLAGLPGIKLISHPRNQGYGQSLIDAFAYARDSGYDWVITMDCDQQHEPESIPRFIGQIRTDKWDIISGSRYLKWDGNGDLPPADRRAINTTITLLLNDLLHLNLTDAFCGFKAHRVAAMANLTLDVPGYAFPLQLWVQAAASGMRITEIPVRLIYNDPTRHFGGSLDDAGHRLAHYLDVLCRELDRAAVPPARELVACSGCCRD